MTEVYLIAGALLMSGAIVMAFRTAAASSVAAYAGIWALRASGYASVNHRTLLFWAVAVMLVISINMAGGSRIPAPRRARYFIVGGAFVGMAAGLTLHQAGAIIGAAAGAVIGAIAYMRMAPHVSKQTIRQWTIAIGLPTVVTTSLISLGIQGILNLNQ
jgi:hypothetical protein